MSKVMSNIEINGRIQNLFLVFSLFDFETLAWIFTERVTYMLFAQQQYVLNTHSTILAYEFLAEKYSVYSKLKTWRS